MVRALHRDGMVVVSGVPPSVDGRLVGPHMAACLGSPEGQAVPGVAALAAMFGTLRTTFYGSTWDVRSVPDASNLAYTGKPLPWHQDLL